MKVEFDLSLSDYMRLAGNAVKEGNFVLCVHNLLDAVDFVNTAEEKSSVWKCLADMYLCGEMYQAGKNSIFKSMNYEYRGGFYLLDFNKFFPEDEEPSKGEFDPESDLVIAYNEVQALIVEGRYQEAIDLFCTLPVCKKCTDEIYALFSELLDSGEKIDFDKDFVYNCIGFLKREIMYESEIEPEFINIIYKMEDNALIKLFEDSLKEILDNIISTERAVLYGEILFLNGRMNAAKKCFNRALEVRNIDEKANYYMGLINYLEDNIKEGDKYFAVLNLCYGRFGLPFEFLKSSISDIERLKEMYKFNFKYDIVFSRNLNKEAISAIGLMKEIDVNDEKYWESVKNVLSFSNERHVMERTMYKISRFPEMFIEIAQEALCSSYVPDENKKFLIEELIKNDYEGTLKVLFSHKLVFTPMVKFSGRTLKKFWRNIYAEISSEILAYDGYLIYSPNLLINIIKEFAKKCSNEKVIPDICDIRFLKYIFANQYMHLQSREYNMPECKLFPDVSGDEFIEGLRKFEPEDIYF